MHHISAFIIHPCVNTLLRRHRQMCLRYSTILSAASDRHITKPTQHSHHQQIIPTRSLHTHTKTTKHSHTVHTPSTHHPHTIPTHQSHDQEILAARFFLHHTPSTHHPHTLHTPSSHHPHTIQLSLRHLPEPMSLLSNSYAVYCLNKKNTHQT